MKILAILLITFIISACSMFGNSGIETAPYTIIEQDGSIEIRHYNNLVLVKTAMPTGMFEGRNQAFQRLFKYISGNNEAKSEIEMTAPVIMQNHITDSGQKIKMTAPVFMSDNSKHQTMSFILPSHYDLQTAPQPKDSSVFLEEIEEYTVAVVQFSGTMNEKNIQHYLKILQNWIDSSHFQETGLYMIAGL